LQATRNVIYAKNSKVVSQLSLSRNQLGVTQFKKSVEIRQQVA